MHSLAVSDSGVLASPSSRSGSQFQRDLVALIPQLRAFARMLCGKRAIAEDMAQEAFVRAFGSLRSLRNSNEFWPWLSRIVVRLCLDRQRHAWWRRELPMEPRACSAQTRSETSSVDTRLLVELLLDQLSPPIRAALVLREIEGMDYSDVALALSIPVGTVRSRLNAARAQFRELWLAALREDDHG